MNGLSSVLAAFGLSASAGLNAYIPLLIVSLMARFTNWVTLSEPWDALSSWWVIGALAILTLVEFFADKFPAVNHANDILQTFVRPAVTATTAGTGNVPVSILEDLVATVLSILAVVVPVLIAALIIILTAFVVWWLWRRANTPQAA